MMSTQDRIKMVQATLENLRRAQLSLAEQKRELEQLREKIKEIL